ncbi:MAG: TolC family protein [Planctomycetota bacterium]|nr:TolC family protein [Planctomycetota bacterium]
MSKPAEEPQAQPTADAKDQNQPKPAGEGVASAGAGYYLSLDEAIELAIQRNLGLLKARLGDRLSDIGVREAWAQYYPEFNSSFIHSNSRQTGQRAGDGSTTLGGGVTQRSPWGTVLGFSLSETRSRFDTDTASGLMALNITQPLWKGRSTDANMAAIRTARIQRLMSRGSLDLFTQSLIFDVRNTYASIIQQIQNREVSRQAIRSAKAFLDLTDARYKAGQVTQLEVFNADVQLRGRELDLIGNERALESAFDSLKQTLDLDLAENIRVDAPIVDFGEKSEPNVTKIIGSDEKSSTVFLTVTRPGQAPERALLFQATHFDESVILQEALQNRIDLLNARRNLAVQKLQTMLGKDGLGHQIDFVGSLGRANTGRSLLEADNGKDVNSWSAGISATFPWGKIRDRAAYERALLALEQTEIALKLARTAVQTQVRDVMRRLRENEKGMLIEGQRVEQAKRLAAAAQISFDRGLKDSFNVIQAEDALLQAKRDFIARQLTYTVLLASLEETVGKPTGRIDLSGQSVGGLVDSRIPEELKARGMPKPAPDVEPSAEDNPLNNSRGYRKDYDADKYTKGLIEEPGK